MASNSYNSFIINQTLKFCSIYELLNLIELIILTESMPKNDANFYALVICFSIAAGKLIDLGAGTSIPQLLKICSPRPNILLLRIFAIHLVFILPLVAIGFLYVTKFSLMLLTLIMIRGTCEAVSSMSRHALYSKLKNFNVARIEIALKLIQVLIVTFLWLSNNISFFNIITISSLFVFINTGLIAHLALKQFINNKNTQSLSLAQTISLHKAIAFLRLQVFSTKISKELLSSYILTPLFSYTYGSDLTWNFFLFASVISSIHTIIKMTVGYSAAGIFSQNKNYAQNKKVLNKHLLKLISSAILILLLSSCFFINTQHQKAFQLASCFALCSFIDLFSLVYEQYFLMIGKYAFYQRTRLIESGVQALIVLIMAKTIGIIAITVILIVLKIIIINFLQHYSIILVAKGLTKTPSPSLVSTPHIFTPTEKTPTFYTQKLSSPQAPTQRERQGVGVAAACLKQKTKSFTLIH